MDRRLGKEEKKTDSERKGNGLLGGVFKRKKEFKKRDEKAKRKERQRKSEVKEKRLEAGTRHEERTYSPS